MRDWLKSLEKSEKRIVSGVEKLDIMRFLVGRFTPVSSGIYILPSLKSSNQSQ